MFKRILSFIIKLIYYCTGIQSNRIFKFKNLIYSNHCDHTKYNHGGSKTKVYSKKV
jgi:hypothetical protein